MTKRPLVVAALSFVAGIVLAVFRIKTAYILPICSIAVLWAILCRRKIIIMAAVIFIFTVFGMLRFESAERIRNETEFKYASRTYDGEILITDFSDNKKVTAEIFDEGKRVKIYLSMKECPKLLPGDIVRSKITLSGISRSKTQKSDFGAYLAGKGTYLYAKGETLTLISQYTKGIRGGVFAVRRYVRETAENAFSGDVLALFCAMVLGDKSLITKELDTALQGAGINHIAVVSGMHLSIMIAAQMLLLNKLFGKKRIGAFFAVLCAFFITLVTGAGASVVRALVMCAVYQLSRILYRENDTINSLFLTFLVMIVFNPYLALNAGLILSVLSVLGIVLYNEKAERVCAKVMPMTFAKTCAVTISAQLGVNLAVIYYFGIITPYAIITNLLVFPFATAIVPLGMVYVLVCNIPVIGIICEAVIEFLSEAIIFISEAVCALPAAITPIGSLGAVLFIAWIFMLTVIYLYPVHIKRLGVISAVFAAVFCTVLVIQNVNDTSLSMQFLNYGTKCSSLISNEKDAILIGCADAYDVKALMENKGIDNIAGGILTDKDYEEMFLLAQNGEVDTVVFPENIFSREETEKLRQSARENNVNLIPLAHKEPAIIGDMMIDYPGSNENAAVRIEYDNKTFITLQSYSGKEIEELEKKGVTFDCDVLKLPYTIMHKGADVTTLTRGKILQKENKFSIKNQVQCRK